MNMLMTLYVVVLFILLTPNILFHLPPGGDKMTVTLVHALIFGLVWSSTKGIVWRATSKQQTKSNYTMPIVGATLY